jgi:hypothetical protein
MVGVAVGVLGATEGRWGRGRAEEYRVFRPVIGFSLKNARKSYRRSDPFRNF